jgi:hypothetical protein
MEEEGYENREFQARGNRGVEKPVVVSSTDLP